MLFHVGEADQPQVALLVLQLQTQPAAAVFHQLQAPLAVGGLLAALHLLADEQVGHLPLKDRRCWIAAQAGVAAAGLQDRPPEHVEQEHHAHHQGDRARLAGEQHALADQQRNYTADQRDEQALQQLLGAAATGVELGAGGHGRDQTGQLTGPQGDQHRIRSGVPGRRPAPPAGAPGAR